MTAAGKGDYVPVYNGKKWWRLACAGFAGAAFTLGAATAAAEPPDWRTLYRDARPILDVRYRFEYVDQAGIANNAEANTVRTRAGVDSGRYMGLGALFDLEWIEAIGARRFNDTINGKTDYPVVADPDDFQVNQLYAEADGTIPHTRFRLGRQRIIWDDQRFVGNVGFRQNEQTFDALRATLLAGADGEAEYTYLDQVNRVFGTKSPQGKLGLRTHGLRGQYRGIAGHKLTPFALLLDYTDANRAVQDTASYGALLQGQHELSGDWSLFYDAAGAYQRDHADNPRRFDLWYARLAPGLKYRNTRLIAGYEFLQGDGTTAVQTPLATLHKFNGFTDKFLVTPPDGLQDFYLTLGSLLPGEGRLSNLRLLASYHQFRSDRDDRRYGWEWNAALTKKIALGPGSLDLGVKYASYSADTFATDTDKLWLSVRYGLGDDTLQQYYGYLTN